MFNVYNTFINGLANTAYFWIPGIVIVIALYMIFTRKRKRNR
ncbi:hypothetical protein [Fodinisporobacter ferrooxydans]